jgi:hypothetical protein
LYSAFPFSKDSLTRAFVASSPSNTSHMCLVRLYNRHEINIILMPRQVLELEILVLLKWRWVLKMLELNNI